MKEDYDLFITKVGKINLARNISKIQELSDSFNLTKVQQGFMRLNVSNEMAADILEWIIRNEGYGLIVPTTYRNPKISSTKAKKIASVELEREIKEVYANVQFDPIQVVDDAPFCWKVCTFSQELIEQGLIPGGICKYVDQVDGHLWTLGDRVKIHKEEFYIECSLKTEISQVEKELKSRLGYFESTDYLDHNVRCLRYNCLLIKVKESPYPGLVEKLHGFSPSLNISIKKIPYGKDFQNSMQIILTLIIYLIDSGIENLVMTSDRGDLIKILEYKSQKLFLNKVTEDWSKYKDILSDYAYEEKEMPIVKLPFSR